jgi:hypothetical protein
MPSGVPAKMLSVPGDTQLTLPCCFHQQTSSRKQRLNLYEHQGPPSRRHQAAGLARHRKSGKLSTVRVRFCCSAKASLSYRCQSHNFTKPSPVWCYVLVLRDGLASSAVCVAGAQASREVPCDASPLFSSRNISKPFILPPSQDQQLLFDIPKWLSCLSRSLL